ncbi:MAG: ligand-binding sensor domain-containing protein [Nitrospirota bacterium]
MRMRMWGVALLVGVAMGGQPQGCDRTETGRVAQPFEYLTREEGYQAPVPGDVTLYQTSGPVTGGSVQALAEGADGAIYAGTFGDGVYRMDPGRARWTAADLGPSDPFIMAFGTTPDGTMFAGTVRGGLFRSEDGRRWTASGEGLGNDQVVAILHDPGSGALYAGTGSGVFRSEDHGRRWTAANRGLEMALARSLALGRDGAVYTGTGGNGLFMSRDRGAAWSSINEGLLDEHGLRENFIRVLAVDRSGTLYAGSFGGGVYKTVDQGRRWTAVNEGLVNLSIRGLAIGSDAIYAATGEGVFRSDNGGRRWESISEGMANTNIQSLLLARDGTLYAGTSAGVAIRSPGGAWRTADRGMLFPAVRALSVNRLRGLFAGTPANGLYRSKDGGQAWGLLNDGLPSRAILALALDEDGTQYAATSDAIYRADWTVSKWVPHTDGFTGAPTALLGAGSRLYAATSSGLFTRAAGDAAWAALELPTASGAVRVTLDREGRPVAAVGRAVFRGERGGGRWSALGVIPGTDEVLGVAAGHAAYAWTRASVYALRGRSSAWEDLSATLPHGVEIRALAVDAGGRRDVALAATSGGVWWREEGGAWHPSRGALSVASFESLIVPDSGLVMAGSTEHGVFVGVNLVPKRGLFGGD